MNNWWQQLAEQFQFESTHAFFQMGEHGLYVWMCYGFVFLAWSYLAMAPSWQTKAFLQQQRRRQERQAALEEEGY